MTNEIAARAKIELLQRRNPNELRGYVAALMDVFGCNNLFNRSNLNSVLEAYIAAELGVIRNATSASLIDADRPDFELYFDDRTEIYELAEVDIAGRRRGDEYASECLGGNVCAWPVEMWATGEQAYRSIFCLEQNPITLDRILRQ